MWRTLTIRERFKIKKAVENRCIPDDVWELLSRMISENENNRNAREKFVDKLISDPNALSEVLSDNTRIKASESGLFND